MSDTPEIKSRNVEGDDSSRSIPASATKPDTGGIASRIPTEGVSTKLKVFVIGLTVVTFIAFGIFTAMLFKKSTSSPPAPDTKTTTHADTPLWDRQALTVAEKLRDAGLYDQALTQYERYLKNPNLDLDTRSNVAYIIGGLYMELGNCREALTWFFHSEVASAKTPWTDDRNKRIDGCLHQLKASP